jgi:hypothetical protein
VVLGKEAEFYRRPLVEYFVSTWTLNDAAKSICAPDSSMAAELGKVYRRIQRTMFGSFLLSRCCSGAKEIDSVVGRDVMLRLFLLRAQVEVVGNFCFTEYRF